jgi:hypothetical protein
MKQSQRVAHFLVPTAQHAPKAMPPPRRPLHDPPPRPAPSVLRPRLGLFPPRAAVGGAPECGEHVADRISGIAFVQAHPWGRGRARGRPVDGTTLARLPPQLAVMPMGPRHGEAEGHAAARGAEAALGPHLPALGRLLAPLVPPHGGRWSWPHPSRALPRQSLLRPRRPLGRSATAPGRHPPPSTLGSGDGRHSWSRGPSPAAHATGRRGGARRTWHPSRCDPRHGAEGPPGGAVCAAGAPVRGAPPTRQEYAQHGGFARGLHASVRLLEEGTFPHRIPSN